MDRRIFKPGKHRTARNFTRAARNPDGCARHCYRSKEPPNRPKRSPQAWNRQTMLLSLQVAVRFKAIASRSPATSRRLVRRSRSLLLLPARGEKVGMRGRHRCLSILRIVQSALSATPPLQSPRSELRRGPLTLLRYAQSTSPRTRGEVHQQSRSRGALASELCNGTNGMRASANEGGGAPKGAYPTSRTTRPDVAVRMCFGRGARHE